MTISRFSPFLASLLLTLLLTAFGPPPPTNPVHGRPKTQARPALSGPVQTYATGHFLIHYTLKGEDAVARTDDDGNGLPDFVEAVAEALEFSWQRQVEAMGWRPPLLDEGEGGDSKLDVYLEDQSHLFGNGDLFGYTDTFGGFTGDNPATPKEETDTAYAYLSLDNDYDPDQFDLYELDPLDAMRTTAAHEFNHALQSAYDDEDPYAWIYEATAVWAEDELYPELDGARSYLADYMDAPDLCPLSVGRDDQDVRWYGGWILLRYLAEQHGGPETIRRLWENMAELDGLTALEATLREQQLTLAELLVNFAVANLLKSDCPANAPYCYAHGSDYLRPYVEGSLRVEAGAAKTFVPKDGVQHFGADYIRLKSDGPIRLAFRGSPAGKWQLRLVGLTGATAKVIPWTHSSPTTADPSAFEKLYLVVVNTAPAEAEEDCGYHNYTLALAAAGNNDPPEAPPLPRDPGPYVPPAYMVGGQEEGVAPAPILSGGQPITLEEAPFPPFYPGYLPFDYSLSDLLSYTSANLDEWAQDYAPGGEPVLGLIYDRGENPDDYLALLQSPAPPQTLAEWVEAMGYLETDIRLVNDHEVHLVEYHDESGRLSVATFIHHDRFIVVEAPFDLIEMQQVVAGFLANNP
ncbi:MAG: hypothetical protein HS126_02550 [Anaerolineales bacterium]|nr:hypothetical protein [Anaerolineales bacterium]